MHISVHLACCERERQYHMLSLHNYLVVACKCFSTGLIRFTLTMIKNEIHLRNYPIAHYNSIEQYRVNSFGNVCDIGFSGEI